MRLWIPLMFGSVLISWQRRQRQNATVARLQRLILLDRARGEAP